MGSNPDKHDRYRSSGNALIAILITLCSGLFIWNIGVLDEITKNAGAQLIIVIIAVADIFLALCVIFSLCALFHHYRGYKSEARSSTDTNTTPEAPKSFDKADWLVPWALVMFFTGALFDAVLLICLKF